MNVSESSFGTEWEIILTMIASEFLSRNFYQISVCSREVASSVSRETIGVARGRLFQAPSTSCPTGRSFLSASDSCFL